MAALLMTLALPAHAANECGVQAGTALVECPAGTYSGGITYGSTANLNISTQGAVDAGATGIDLTLNGSNTLNLNTTAGAVTGAGGIDISSGTGAITVNAGSVTGGIEVNALNGAVTVNSSNADIVINRFRTLTDTASISGNITATTAGNVNIVRAGSGNVIVDTSSGTGAAVITQTNTGRTNSVMGSLTANIGSGGLVLNVTGVAPPTTAGSPNPGNSSVNGVTLRGAGNAEINIARSEFWPTQTNGALLTSYATLGGTLNFSDLDGDVLLNVGSGGVWKIGATPVAFSQGQTRIVIGEGGLFWTEPPSSNQAAPWPASTRRLTFNTAGTDTIDNHGQWIVGYFEQPNLQRPDYPDNKGDLRLENLGTFNNYGDIHLGAVIILRDRLLSNDFLPGVGPKFNRPRGFNGTDRAVDDILSMEGATFVGHEGSRIFMDVDMRQEAGTQSGCDNALRNPDNDNQLPGADCVNLRGGRTEGVTGLVLNDIHIGNGGVINREGIVVVDVAGGESAQGHFVVDPASYRYSPAAGGSYDLGFLLYTVQYDEDNQQHKLFGLPSGAAQHQPMILSAATSAWRAATGSFFDRQADLRDTLRGGNSRQNGVWLRSSYEQGERDLRTPESTSIGPVEFNNRHDADTSTVTLGVDFLSGGSGDRHWLIGGTVGYVRTDLNYAAWTDTAFMNGMSLGLYASWVDGPLFVDGVISSVWSRLDQHVPVAQFFDNRPISADVESLGAQLEAGWRFDLGAVRLEPLVNLSHVGSSIEDMKAPAPDPIAPGIGLRFEDVTSTRGGLGLRASTAFPVFGDVQLGLSLTGRVSSEFDGEGRVTVVTTGSVDPQMTDKFDGTFSEFIGGVTLANSTGRVSGVLNVGLRSGDDYSATSGSFGFRYQW